MLTQKMAKTQPFAIREGSLWIKLVGQDCLLLSSFKLFFIYIFSGMYLAWGTGLIASICAYYPLLACSVA